MKKIFTLFYFVLLVSIIYGQTPKSQRMVLVEEFTQASCGPCAAANPALRTLLAANTSKVIALKYQTSWPGVDPMNAANPTDVATRVSYYTYISGVPMVVIDGDTIHDSGSAYTGYPGDLTQAYINTEYAVSAPFTINLSHTMSAHYDSVFITCNLTATAAGTYSSGLKLQVALSEDEIDFCAAPGANGEKVFYNVMRQMIPNASGTTLATTWTANQTDPHTFAVKLPTYIYDKNRLSIVAFIQSTSDKSVQQTAYSAPIQLQLDGGFGCNAISGIPSMTCSPSIAPIVTLKNFGSTTLTSATINYKVDASSSYTGYAWSGSLASGSTTNVTLPSSSVTSGAHTYYVSVVSPNSGTDYNSKNDLLTTAFNVGISSGATVPPLVEGFTLSTFPPTGWINVDVTNSGTKWARSSSYGGFGTSTNSTWIYFYNIAAGNMEELIVKPVDLSGGSTATLTFDLAYAQYSATYVDTVAVMVSTNCGSTWDTPYQKYGSTLATNGGTLVTSSFTPTASTWRTESVDLSPYTGNQVAYLKFHAGSGYGNNAYVDNINVTVVTSVENIDADKSIGMYPNPSNGQVTVTGLKNANISVFNLLGNKVMEVNNVTGNKQLNLSNFDSGAYIVQILSDKKVTKKKLLLDK